MHQELNNLYPKLDLLPNLSVREPTMIATAIRPNLFLDLKQNLRRFRKQHFSSWCPNSGLTQYLNKNTKAAPLAVFRILFGLLMLIAVIRFWYNGWIEKLYIDPLFHFHYSGFSFIDASSSPVYLLFVLSGISAAFVCFGYKYRIAIIVFFFSFTWIELLDKTTYLNHYYFVSVIAFILMFLPAHCTFSIDAFRHDDLRYEFIPSWNIDILKLMLAIVYIYAGLAKLNSDWMFHAMPLSLWLPSKFEVPLLGSWMHEKWMHYLFSWAGAIYDIFIVALLLCKSTRLFGFAAVVIFHLLTRVLFPIGMFPYIMIAASLIFFSPSWHLRILNKLTTLFGINGDVFSNGKRTSFGRPPSISLILLSAFMCFQLIFPLRHFIFPGNVYWTERGYRFSWRVMLMEKTGYANFKIVNGVTGNRFYIQNGDFLTAFQEKQMATQPDFILEYGKFLGKHFAEQGHEHVEVYVESYVALNGRASQPYVRSDVDLMKTTYTKLCNQYLTPFNE